jgi:hypothetical protein
MRTDMVVYQITLDQAKLDVSVDNLWVSSAAQTLAEAMALSAGKLLDIEFTDIKSGFRIRYGSNQVFVDIFLFDNLSSGAGYSSAVAERSEELFLVTNETLITCKNNCESACQECLKHFWNQNVKVPLDRRLGLDLLNWLCYGELHDEIAFTEQAKIFAPLAKLLEPQFEVVIQNDAISIIGSKSLNIYIYPAMWNKNDCRIPKNSIALPDRILQHSLPEAYRQLIDVLAY